MKTPSGICDGIRPIGAPCRALSHLSLVVIVTVLFSLAASAQYAPPSSGLVSWWRGNGTATDSADGNNGMALNGATYGSGISGAAFSFDGIDDHVRVTDSINLRITSAITLGAWVNRRSTGSFDEIISKWDAVWVDQRSYTMTITPDGYPSFSVSPFGTPTAGSVNGTSPVPLNTWTHIAGVYDGSNLRIYVNGVQRGQTAYSSGIFSGSSDLSIGAAVGGVGVGGGISFFDGLLDEVVIYNRALSAGEVVTLATIPEPTAAALLLLSGGAFVGRWLQRKK
jgi:hypothetical protein